jgi:hypothetical protein
MNWWEWVFSGIGVLAVALLIEWLRRRPHPSGQQATITAQGARVSDSPVASGSNILQTVNSPTYNVSLRVPTAAGAPGNERYSEWRELIHELHESFQQIGYAFLPLNVITTGIETNDYEAGIRRGYHVLRNRILIADVLKNAGMMEKFQKIVEYAVSADTPRDPSQRGCPTVTGFDIMASKFEDELMDIARKDAGYADQSSWLELFKEKQRLEEELASLEARIPSIRVVPAMKIGKDDTDLLREEIERKKNEIRQIDEIMKGLAHD